MPTRGWQGHGIMVSGTLKARRCNFTPQIQAVWISATSAVVSLYDCTFSAGDRTGTTEEDVFIYAGGVSIDYGNCTFGSARGEPGANVPVLRDGRTNFSSCPYLCPGGYGDSAGYEDAAGSCVTPRTYVSSTSVTKDVRVSIHKESAGSLSYVHDVTLRVEGTDRAAMNHSVVMSPNVGWLTLPSNATRMEASDQVELPLVPLLFSASGLMEQTEPYTTTVHLLGQALATSNQLALNVQPLTAAFAMNVTLQVSATTVANTTTWGMFSPDQARAGCANISSPGVLEVRIGQTVTQSFTACDLEALPVNHPLPGARDARTFGARLARVGNDGTPEATSTTQAVVYASAGVYDVQVVAPAVIGPYRLTLALNDEAVPGHVDVRVICSQGLIELADGISCGCEAGEYLKADGTQCLPCLPTFYSARGASACLPCGRPSDKGEPNAGMDCEGGVLKGTHRDFWASQALTTVNANQSNTFACDTPGVCLGGKESACAAGHEGPLCSVCSKGYYATPEQLCTPCDVEPLGDGVRAAVLLLGFLLGVTLGLFVMCAAAALMEPHTRIWRQRTPAHTPQLLGSVLSCIHGL